LKKDGKGLKGIMKREGEFLERNGTGKYRNKAGVGRNWTIEERRSKRIPAGGLEEDKQGKE
jgi:hypothetical protein